MLSVGRVGAGEGAELRELRLRALADAPEAFNSTFVDMEARPESYWHERAAAASVGETQCLFIAEEAGQWLGMAGGTVDHEQEGAVEVISMWVDSAVRGRGIGRKLLDAVRTWAKEAGAVQLKLWVTETNAAAVGLYLATGFRPTGKAQILPSHPWLQVIEMQSTIT